VTGDDELVERVVLNYGYAWCDHGAYTAAYSDTQGCSCIKAASDSAAAFDLAGINES
jgi:hypothetical protein